MPGCISVKCSCLAVWWCPHAVLGCTGGAAGNTGGLGPAGAALSSKEWDQADLRLCWETEPRGVLIIPVAQRNRAGLWLLPAQEEQRNKANHTELLAGVFIDDKVWVTPCSQHWLTALHQPLPVEPCASLHITSLLVVLRAGAGTALPYCSRAISALGAIPGRAQALGAVQPRKAIPVGMCHASPMGQSSGLTAFGLALYPHTGDSHPLVAVVREGGHELWLTGCGGESRGQHSTEHPNPAPWEATYAGASP